MKRVVLTIEQVEILRPKTTWNLYFVVIIPHPTDPELRLMTILPNEYFRLSSRHENKFDFTGGGEGAEGLFVMGFPMPENREFNVHIYLRHSRDTTRRIGQILTDIEKRLDKGVIGTITDIAGAAVAPWLILGKEAFEMVGKVLADLPDRDFGFLSAYERFGPEFESQTEVDRQKDFTGNARLVYTWGISED